MNELSIYMNPTKQLKHFKLSKSLVDLKKEEKKIAAFGQIQGVSEVYV